MISKGFLFVVVGVVVGLVQNATFRKIPLQNLPHP